MARTVLISIALGFASITSLASAPEQASSPQAQPAQPAAPAPAQPAQGRPAQPRPAAPTQQGRTLNANRPVQSPAARPAVPAQAPRAPQQPMQQNDAAQQAALADEGAPQVGGYSNSGGLVDSTALQTQAEQGVHYHYHYYGAGAVVSQAGGYAQPGYAQAGYVNPATAPMPNNPYLTPIYGPGNPAPMNTLLGAGNDNTNPVGGGEGGGVGRAAAAAVGGQAWSYGGGIGHWNPYAYGGNGYVEGFND